MRYRITVRGEHGELRGYLEENVDLVAFAESMRPLGPVMASPADDDYNPFKEEQFRELHHFETEQRMDDALGYLKSIAAQPGNVLSYVLDGIEEAIERLEGKQ